MQIKRIKRILVFVALSVIVLLITGCGSDINLGASMSELNEPDEASATVEDYDESAEAEEYDNESADADDEEDEHVESAEEQITDEEDKQADSAEEQVADDRIVTVILNTNKDRKRIHIPGTSCANQIHEENYLEWTGTESELVEYAKEHGYVACGRCHPDVKLGIDLPHND